MHSATLIFLMCVELPRALVRGCLHNPFAKNSVLREIIKLDENSAASGDTGNIRGSGKLARSLSPIQFIPLSLGVFVNLGG
eukprot:198867-Pyramimonas_sp.AAC.1